MEWIVFLKEKFCKCFLITLLKNNWKKSQFFSLKVLIIIIVLKSEFYYFNPTQPVLKLKVLVRT